MSQTATATRLPAAGTWNIDPAHSSIEATARHMMITKVRGRFNEFTGTIHVDEDPTKSWAEATIKSASIDTNSPQRDEHLRSPDFLDVENYPELTFRSTGLEKVSDERFKATGNLTIRGVTKPVTLDVEFGGVGTNPWGVEVAMFSATTEIDREEFGMTWNQALEAGGVLVGKKITISIEAQVARA